MALTGVPPPGAAPRRGLVANLISSLRPNQWTKNLVVFAGLLFGEQLLDPGAVARAAGMFAVFCSLSSAMYLINDLGDRARDRMHPVKATRPIAAGLVTPATAWGAAAVLLAGGLLGAFLLGVRAGAAALAFATLLSLYTGVFKAIAILDVLAIAVGFVLRAAAGAIVIAVPISQWLLVCTLLLALFLGLTKRYQEVTALDGEAARHRPALAHYDAAVLDQMVTVVAAATLVSYTVYASVADTVEQFGTDLLTLTIPFPVYGILRYLMLVRDDRYRSSQGPAEILMRDRPLALCVAGWVLSTAVIIYRPFTS